MISCTEFIPLYSEFFKFLESKGGHDEVLKYWYNISDKNLGNKTNPNSLASKCEKFGGFKGAIAYWNHTLTEEACDLFEFRDYNKNIYFSHMRHCPSRGILNALDHVEPYYDYCSHCNVIYQRVLKNYGIVYDRDNSKIENAECCSVLYEEGKKPDFDFTTIKDDALLKLKGQDGIEIIDMKAEDNKYLHRDFHISGDKAIQYCADNFGHDKAINFLTTYVKHFYAPKINDAKERGLIAVKEWIEDTYEKEEASHLLKTELSEDKLTVTIEKSPVIEYVRSINQEVSKYYIEQTRTLYKVFSDEAGFNFTLEYYNEKDGSTKFTFEK